MITLAALLSSCASVPRLPVGTPREVGCAEASRSGAAWTAGSPAPVALPAARACGVHADVIATSCTSETCFVVFWPSVVGAGELEACLWQAGALSVRTESLDPGNTGHSSLRWACAAVSR